LLEDTIGSGRAATVSLALFGRDRRVIGAMGVAGAQAPGVQRHPAERAQVARLVLVDQQHPERLETLNAVGLPESVLAGWQALPVSAPSPSRQAVAASAPVYLPTLADLAARYPDGYQVLGRSEYDRDLVMGVQHILLPEDLPDCQG
jgi:hypothetical protein